MVSQQNALIKHLALKLAQLQALSEEDNELLKATQNLAESVTGESSI